MFLALLMKKKTLEFCKVLSFFCFVFLTSIQISHSQNYIWEQVSNFSKANLNKSKINASVYNLRVHDFEQKLNNVSSNNKMVLLVYLDILNHLTNRNQGSRTLSEVLNLHL